MYQNPEAIKKKRWRKKGEVLTYSIYIQSIIAVSHFSSGLPALNTSLTYVWVHITLSRKALVFLFPLSLREVWSRCANVWPLSGAQSGKKRPVLLQRLKHSCSLRPQSDKSTKMEASSQAKYIIEYWEIVSNEMYDPATLSFLISKLQWDLKLPTFMSFTES